MNKICRKCDSTTTTKANILDTGDKKALQIYYDYSIFCYNCDSLELLTKDEWMDHD